MGVILKGIIYILWYFIVSVKKCHEFMYVNLVSCYIAEFISFNSFCEDFLGLSIYSIMSSAYNENFTSSLPIWVILFLFLGWLLWLRLCWKEVVRERASLSYSSWTFYHCVKGPWSGLIFRRWQIFVSDPVNLQWGLKNAFQQNSQMIFSVLGLFGFWGGGDTYTQE